MNKELKIIKKIVICGVGVHKISIDETIDYTENAIINRRLIYVVTANVDHIVTLQNDYEFKGVYGRASLVVADGVPLLWAAQFLGTPLKGRVNGTDLFERLCALSAEKGYKLFLFGGRAGAAAKASNMLKERYPNIKITGVYSPPFGFENINGENEKIVRLIRDAKPDILFVGLGAPKQEKWIYKHKDSHNVPVSIGIGASFELVAGLVKRSPVWMQRIGLEWLWRLMMEPTRLWKRYLVDDVKFICLVLRQKIGYLKQVS